MGNRNDFLDDLDYIFDRGIEDEVEDDFVVGQRRYKERAAAAFAEDLAELRRKRRDMQVIFAFGTRTVPNKSIGTRNILSRNRV